MTYEDVKRTRENPTVESCDIKELQKLIDLAIERQIPKKPKDEYCLKTLVNFSCPAWGIAQGGSVVKELTLFCYHCGQAFDWRDTGCLMQRL